MQTSKTHFDEYDLAAMQEAFGAACADLDLTLSAQMQRERLAEIICEIVKTGERTAPGIRRRAVECYRNLPGQLVNFDRGSSS